MKLYEKDHALAKLTFKYSPFFEMICSLHVLFKLEHHLERLNWAKEIKEKLDVKFYERLVYLGTNSQEWMGIMEFCELSENFNDFNVIVAIESLLEVSLENLFYTVFNGRVELKLIKSKKGLSKDQL